MNMKMARIFTMLTVIVMTLMTGAMGEASAGDLAIIVSKRNETNELSFKEVVKIFKQDRQYWREGGGKIHIVLQESGAGEKKIFLDRVYKMDDKSLKKYWLGKLYRGEIASFPKTLSSNEAVKRFVTQAPNAVGFIDAMVADSAVKVLRIDGRMPGDPGYPLTDH